MKIKMLMLLVLMPNWLSSQTSMPIVKITTDAPTEQTLLSIMAIHPEWTGG